MSDAMTLSELIHRNIRLRVGYRCGETPDSVSDSRVNTEINCLTMVELIQFISEAMDEMKEEAREAKYGSVREGEKA